MAGSGNPTPILARQIAETRLAEAATVAATLPNMPPELPALLAQARQELKHAEGLLTAALQKEPGLAKAQRATDVFFGAEIDDLSDAELGEIFADVLSRELPRGRLAGEGLPLVEAWAEAGLAKSKGEARRTIEQGGAYVNNRRCAGVDTRLTEEDLASETIMVLRSGKKRYALLRFVG